jgi:hypothetical protein
MTVEALARDGRVLSLALIAAGGFLPARAIWYTVSR